MTYAKTGTEFPADCANVDLSDVAYRTHHEVICWLFLVERTDCLIPKRLLRKVAGSDDYEKAVPELLAIGFWQEHEYEYEVAHHADVIRGGIIAQQKKRDRDKKAQATHRKRHASTADVSADVSDYPDRQTDNHAVRREQEPEGWRTT